MSLPPAAKKALAIILREKSLTSVKAWKAVDAAFAAVGWTDPEGDVLPLAKDLTAAQRALFEKLATRDGHDLARFGVPDVRHEREEDGPPHILAAKAGPLHAASRGAS